MGKRILVQRRGRGYANMQTPTHRRRGQVKYIHSRKGSETIKAVIKDLIHDPGRGAPLAIIQFENGKKTLYLPPEGIFVGDTIEIGENAKIEVGNITTLRNVPEGTYIFNIEGQSNDGGKYVRSSGLYATVLTKEQNYVNVSLPSGKIKKFTLDCRCTIGVVAAGGRTTKPFIRAGNKYYWARNKHMIWPRTRANAMNACSHPFGGGRHKAPHKPKTVSRNAPPGRKVGLIAARRAGRRK